MAFSLTRDPHTLAQRELPRQEQALVIGLFLLGAILIGAVLLVDPRPAVTPSLAVGDISPRDIICPRSLTYVSAVLTERARQAAEAQVGTVYDAPDLSVGRRQVNMARQLLDRMRSIRSDEQMDASQKAEAIGALEELSLSEATVGFILSFSEEQWLAVEHEVVRVVDQAMRMVIREVDLPEARRRVPTLLSFDLSDEQVQVVVDIASDLVQPNTFANEARTLEARAKAREQVQPVSISWEAGQVVARAGDRITELQAEALQQLGLLEPRHEWPRDTARVVALMLLGVLLAQYVLVREPELGENWRRLALVPGLGLIFAAVARATMPGHVLLPYVFPAAALPMLVAALASPGLALPVALLPAVFPIYLAQGAQLELCAYGLLGGIAGALALSQVHRLTSFLRAGIAVALVNLTVVLCGSAVSGTRDTPGMISLAAAALLNGGACGAITLLGYMAASSVSGGVTSLQLLELGRPTQPLLRELLLKAPGTYHHSVIVANMAEQAAERIGANALLARVGSYYHDVGKVQRPYFFSENQVEGANVHDRLDPVTSARVIISHVAEGVALAKRERLPASLVAFIAEHHGRTRQNSFYDEAVRLYGAEGVDESLFRYPGPRPRSKETAIVMLADACEAAVRSCRPETTAELAALVGRLVNERLMSGELDESPLTLQDVAVIKDVFVNVLQGVFHPRVPYPESNGEALGELAGNGQFPSGSVRQA